ncbi:HNH endonuclease, partial [Vibrio vulnificus]|nr:HNH endonuclease [Vibrio vulnificus]
LDEKFTAKSVQSRGEDKIAIHDLYHYVSSMKNSVETWYEISNPTDSSLNKDVVFWLEKINRGKTTRYLPLIMVSLQKEKDTNKLVKFLKIIEKQMFLSMLSNSGYYMEYDNSHFILWASELSHGSTNLDKIITKLESSFEVFKKSPDLLLRIGEHFKEGGFYRWHGLRYFMYEYEEMLRKESKSYTIKLNPDDFFVDRPIYDIDDRDHKTIEHVYPQNPRQKEWTERYKRYSAPQRTLLRHSLGNLVPLSQPKNSSFQNKPFLQKVGNHENTIGFKYGSFSEIELTKHKEWTPVEILNRGLQLLDFMEKRWGIKFGSIENKIKFLRLNFVIDIENLEIGTKEVHKITL